MKKLVLISVAAFAFAAQAYSYIDQDAVTWDQPTDTVISTFTLVGGPAFVTADILTNGVSVGTAGLAGDINKVLAPGPHSFTYTPQGWRHSVKNAVSVKFTVTEQSRANTDDYLAVNLVDGSHVFYAKATDVPGGVTDAKWKTTHLLLKRVAAANITTMIGKNPRYETVNRSDDGGNNHGAEVYASPVAMTGDYYLGIYEFTAGQWEALSKGTLTGTTNPSSTGKKTAFTSAMTKHYSTHQTDWAYHPCNNLSQTAAAQLMDDLTSKSGLAFALPTDEQWEYACRAGSPTAHYLINGAEPTSTTSTDRAKYAVTFATQKTYYGGDKGTTTHPGYADSLPVGTQSANPWGFYDLYGNLREWTSTVEDSTAATLRYVVRGDSCAMSGTFDCSGGRQSWPAAKTDTYTGFRACFNVSPLQ